jgi:hypothetical protein
MVRDVRVTDGAEVRRIVLVEDPEAVRGHAVAGPEVPLAGPVEVADRDVEASGDGPDAPERVEAHRHHFLADAVTRDDGEPERPRYFGTFWAKLLS